MRILVCPLNWGLGHAARCAPIIQILTAGGHKVVLAGYGRSLSFLEQEFPSLPTEKLLGKTIRYNSSNHLLLSVALQLPGFFLSIIKEHFALAKLVKQYRVQIVISDNRFGVWNRDTKNIYITHQLRIQLGDKKKLSKILEALLEKVQKYVLSPFDEIWTPDVLKTPNLSGLLSHTEPPWKNQLFIGPLSRFSSRTNPGQHSESPEFEVLAVISGPEPARELFEKLLISELKKIPGKHVLVAGKPELTGKKHKMEKTVEANIHIYPHLSGEKLHSLLASAKFVICRSGYSTVMELAKLGRKNVAFVPTPGQPEQLYLAEKYQRDNMAPYQLQEDLDLPNLLLSLEKCTGFNGAFQEDLSLDNFLKAHPFFQLTTDSK